MSYLHIENLYKNQKILNFKRCYALEKVHGTSAHIKWKDGKLTFFSGGEKHDRFVELFDKDNLINGFNILGHKEVTVYGEAYGGKQQGMKDTYGPNLCFIVFDVKVGENWLNVPGMDQIAKGLGLEVVPWEEVSTDLDVLNEIRDRPSEVAIRRGCGADKKREGVVLRPLEEMIVNNDHRVIAKHKIDKFGERNTPQDVKNIDPNKLVILSEATAIAKEWVTEERLSHVISHLTLDGKEPSIENMREIINEMINDIYREAEGEIVESREAKSAIGARTAQMFKQHLHQILNTFYGSK